MELKLSLRVNSLQEFKTDIAKLDGRMKSVAVKIVNFHGSKMFVYAKMGIYSGIAGQTEAPPVDRGLLGSTLSLDFTKSGMVATVGSPMKYAPFVHFGTGPKGFRTFDREYKPDSYVHRMGQGKMPPLQLIKEWVLRKGIAKGDEADRVAFLIAKSIAKNGTNARPFLSYAVRKVKPEYEMALKRFFEAVEFRSAG